MTIFKRLAYMTILKRLAYVTILKRLAYMTIDFQWKLEAFSSYFFLNILCIPIYFYYGKHRMSM